MLNKYCYLFFLVWFIGCKSPAYTSATTNSNSTSSKYQEQLENMNERFYFRAQGNSPEWNLKISEDKVDFTSVDTDFKSFSAPHVQAVRAMDANVKRYAMTTEMGMIIITIQQQKCTTTNNGEALPYSVQVEVKKNSGIEKTFNGCGQYIIDSRLHDIWVLEKMNGKPISTNTLKKEMPYIELNSSNGTFMGFGGCNRIRGTVFYEKELLRFTAISATKMYCGEENPENQFLQLLKSTTTYHIENLRLTLSNPSGVALVFKKVD